MRMTGRGHRHFLFCLLSDVTTFFFPLEVVTNNYFYNMFLLIIDLHEFALVSIREHLSLTSNTSQSVSRRDLDVD